MRWDELLSRLETRASRVEEQEQRARDARAELVDDARQLVAHGCPVADVARALGVSRQRVYVLLNGR